MESALTFITLLSMILIANITVDARPDPSLEAVMKDGSMPRTAAMEGHRVPRPEETIEGLLRKGTHSVLHTLHNKNIDHDCRTSAAAAKRDDHDHEKASFKDFEPRPNISAYDDDDEKLTEKKPSGVDHRDFEPRPNISAYNDNEVRRQPEEEKEATHHVHDFEPRPNISAYDNDVGLKKEKGHKVDDDFEPRPNISIYHD